MFFSLFLSKNQKLVKNWKKEHKQIVKLATNVITAYSNNKMTTAKKELKALRLVALNHLMTEDIEFHKLLENKSTLETETKYFINEFKNSFYDTKSVLRHFLKDYSRDDAVLDDKFFEAFKGLVAVLAERIEFEEKNLYSKLDS